MMGADFYQPTSEIIENDHNGTPNMGIGKYCYIENAILDKNCAIGDNVRILGGNHLPDGDFEGYSIKDGIVVVKKGAVIPSESELVSQDAWSTVSRSALYTRHMTSIN